MIFLGIDTSNYKTSLAAVNEAGEVLYDVSEYIYVPEGERGLRQSDVFFKHSNRLPDLCEDLLSSIDKSRIAAIGASYAPRRVEGSYMPCFSAGINLAKTLSAALDVPLHEFSHQEGHAAAVIESDNKDIPDGEFLFMHLSGGTTEILKCRADEAGYNMKKVGGSLDISFGQLLDRFGVALGLPFPSGMYIDRLASMHRGDSMPGVINRIGVKDGYFNLSGPETRLMHFAADYLEKSSAIEISDTGDIRHDEESAAVSFEIISKIADIICEAVGQISNSDNISRVYIAGGVASSETLRRMIADKYKNNTCDILFGSPALSGDNAVGTAILAKRIYSRK